LQKAQSTASALQTRVALAEAELADKVSELNASKGALSTALRDVDRSRADLAKARKDLTTSVSDVRKLQTALDEAKTRAETSEAQRLKLSENLEAARATREKLEAQVSTLQKTIDRLKAERDAAVIPPGDEPASDDGDVPQRSSADVRNALEGMPGYARLAQDKQDELARRLEDGECVADALKNSLGRVPAVALRNLIRDLGSKC
jgi:DNA repair exonuclease SbcCD ATPase subunit